MASFTYRAVSHSGEQVAGVVTAENYQVALRMLDEKSLYPIRVTEGIGRMGGASGFRRVKTAQLTTFFSQLADLLSAGVPMLRALDVLAKQGSHGSLNLIIREVREDVAGGMPLGDAMAKHPRAFTHLQSSMITAGEQGGFLEDVLNRVAIFLEKQDELQKKVLGAMLYPLVLVVVGGTVVILLMTLVVPKLLSALPPESFNVFTTMLVRTTDILQHHYLAIIVSAVVAVVTTSSLLRTTTGQRWYALFKLKAPILGPVLTMVAICRFCRILGTMLHNGVSILHALKISKDSAGNPVLAEVIEQAAESVRKGAAVSVPLGESGLFPPTVVDMISVAEESNNLETVLVQIANTNEARTARMIDLGVRVIEPVLLVFMGGVVAVIAMALLLPILSMGAGLQ